MGNIEIGLSPPVAKWVVHEQKIFEPEIAGDPLPFLENEPNEYIFAPLNNGLREYFMSNAKHEWKYMDIQFRHAADDILYLNTLLDFAILRSNPEWDMELLDTLELPMFTDKQMLFTGLGIGGSFRAAISKPEYYTNTAIVHQRLYGDLPDNMDIDKKLPTTESFDDLLENRIAPNFIDFLAGNVFEVLALETDDQNILFQGVMRVSDENDPLSYVTIKIIHYEHISALEIRLSSSRSRDNDIADFTIHLTNYERDLRVGPQMPASMNTCVPLYLYTDAQDGFRRLKDGTSIETQQWMILPVQKFQALNAVFKHPEEILQPEYQTIEEAIHDGLRAITEKSQHLGQFKDSQIPLDELLHGDWWQKYRKELLSLLYFKKTEDRVFGRENKFINEEIIKLYSRLLDYDAELFLRMAQPMGIMDVLEPSLRGFLFEYGYMLFGPNFTFAESWRVDSAIQMFYLQFPTWRTRFGGEGWKINKPELLGSQTFLSLMDRYRKLKKKRFRGPLKKLQRYMHSPRR